MISYIFVTYLFYFFVYCFIGWIIESFWVSLHQKRFVNRGFMRGPFIPIYGFGAIALLLSGSRLLQYPVAVFFAGLLAASLLEYFTGAAMEAIFKVRYWDYSDKPFNINGHICLFTSLAWGFLSLVENYVLHKPIEKLAQWLGKDAVYFISAGVSIYFLVDLTLSFKAAFDLRDLVVRMEAVKKDLAIMQKRLDVILAYANADVIEAREKANEKLEDITASVETRLENLKKLLEDKPQEFADNISDEYHELREKFLVHRSNRFGLDDFKNYYKRGIILGNPGMVSKKFKDTVETIKKHVADIINR